MRGPELTFSSEPGTIDIHCRVCEQHCRGRRVCKIQIGPGVCSYFCEFCVGAMTKSLGSGTVKESKSRRRKVVENTCPPNQ